MIIVPCDYESVQNLLEAYVYCYLSRRLKINLVLSCLVYLGESSLNAKSSFRSFLYVYIKRGKAGVDRKRFNCLL